MPGKKIWTVGPGSTEDFIADHLPPKKAAKRLRPVKKDYAMTQFQDMLCERKHYIESYPLKTVDQTTFALQQDFEPKYMNKEQISLIFQWILHSMGMGTSISDWRSDIQVTISCRYLGAVIQSMYFFHRKMPEQITAIDCSRVSIATPGFDTLYDPSTPKNKVYSPTKIDRIKQDILDMGDNNRIALNERLREENIELFRWSEDGAVPFRPNVPILKKKEQSRRVTW